MPAASVGTGNIAGVATAIALGGPGAIFYLWLIALFGMATKYAEAVCAVTYREKDVTGKFVGGPMYYLRNGVGEFAPELGRWLGFRYQLALDRATDNEITCTVGPQYGSSQPDTSDTDATSTTVTFAPGTTQSDDITVNVAADSTTESVELLTIAATCEPTTASMLALGSPVNTAPVSYGVALRDPASTGPNISPRP